MVRVTRGYPHVNFRYTVAPLSTVPSAGFIPVNGSFESMKEEMGIGHRDGLKAIKDAKKSGINSNLQSTLDNLKKLSSGENRDSTKFL